MPLRSQRTTVAGALLASATLLDRGPDSSPSGSLRWWRWLAAGVLAGLLVGFAAGLAKPRIRS